MVPISDAALPRSTPEAQGIASTALLQFIEAMDTHVNQIHSLMLLRHGYVIAEAWWSPYAPEYPQLLFSLSKSFTATAVGLAIAEGYFAIDDPVIAFFPEQTPAEVSTLLAAMRVRDLLSMATGHADDPWLSMVSRQDGNWIKGFLETPVVYTPGTHFVYNTSATYMLSAIVQQTTTIRLDEYLKPRLFAPLGIEHVDWHVSPQGITLGGIGLSLTTVAIARFGQLYLQKGRWNGVQLLPQAWVEQATAGQISNGDDPDSDWTQGYGYQFWRCRHGAYRGDGVFGQYCIVMPEQDAVLAITAGVDVFAMQQPLNLVWEYLLPAMQADRLIDDVLAQQRLTEKLAHLQVPTIHGESSSVIAQRVSGRSYQVDSNIKLIETIRFVFSATSCRVVVQTAAATETIVCGYSTWSLGRSSLFAQHFFTDTPIMARGDWTADDRFTVVVRLYQTPFVYTIESHFVEDELLITIQINVSLDSLAPLVLTARQIP